MEFFDTIPRSKKEQAFAMLAECHYNKDELAAALPSIKPVDGSDWSDEQKVQYHAEIFRLRKNMRKLSKSLGISMKECLAYYIGHFKKSNDYRLLKTVVNEEKTNPEDQVGFDSCAVCGDGGSLIICDACESEYHIECLDPPLKEVPEGDWECDECVDRKLLEAQADMIMNSASLFEQLSGDKGKTDYHVTAAARASVESLTAAIAQAFARRTEPEVHTS